MLKWQRVLSRDGLLAMRSATRKRVPLLARTRFKLLEELIESFVLRLEL